MTAPAEVSALADTPLGPIWAAVSPSGVVAVMLRAPGEAAFMAEVERLTGARPTAGPTNGRGAPGAVLDETLAQLDGYLHGRQRDFTLPIDWSVMTPFQVEVLRHVCEVPYGRLTTYGAVAAALGRPGAARAVGRANATNPIPLVIPCHRVLGGDGRLHGYGAGLDVKAWLLQQEGSWLL